MSETASSMLLQLQTHLTSKARLVREELDELERYVETRSSFSSTDRVALLTSIKSMRRNLSMIVPA